MSEIQKSTKAKNLKLAFAPLVTNILTEGGQTAKIALEIKNTSNKAINLFANDKGNAGADSFTFCIEFPMGVLKKTLDQTQDTDRNFSKETTIGDWKVRTSANKVYFLATSPLAIETGQELKLDIGKLFVNRDSTSTQVTFTYRHISSAEESKEAVQRNIKKVNNQLKGCNTNIQKLNKRVATLSANITKQKALLNTTKSQASRQKGFAKNAAVVRVKQIQASIAALNKQTTIQKENIERQKKLKANLTKRSNNLKNKLKTLKGTITTEEFTQTHFVTLDQTKAPLEMSATVHGTLINTGIDNTLEVFLVNTSRNEIEFSTKSTLQIVFKKGADEPHALTDQDETTTNITVSNFSVEQNQTALDPTYDLKCTKKIELKPEQFIKITIKNLKTTLSPRIGFLYIDYEKIADYRDGRLIVPVSMGSAGYRQSDSTLRIHSKYIDVLSPNPVILYNQGIRARKNFLLYSDNGLNINVQSGKDLSLTSKGNIGINANGGKNSVNITGSNINLHGNTIFDKIEFRRKDKSETGGVERTDLARIYGEHRKNATKSSFVFEIGDDDDDSLTFRSRHHKKGVKDVMNIYHDSIHVGGRKPFLLRQYTNVQLNVNYNTKVDAGAWDALIAGWDGTFDIREGGKHNNSAQMFIKDGKWWIDVDFAAHSGTEKAKLKVTVLFIKRELCQRDGSFT